ncbi:hypothetical protein D3C75_468720 [compost metagenome]
MTDMVLDFSGHCLIILIRVKMNGDPQPAGIRHKSGMPPALDNGGINGSRTRREAGIMLHNRPMALQLLEAADELHHLLDGAGAEDTASGMEHTGPHPVMMHLGALHRQPSGDDTALALNGQIAGVHHHRIVIPLRQSPLRNGACARFTRFFAYGALELQIAAQFDAFLCQHPKRQQSGGQRSFHIRRAPAHSPIPLHPESEGIPQPFCRLAYLRHIHVAV